MKFHAPITPKFVGRRVAGRRATSVKSRRTSGFTLVEMLVAVALVLLMMTLFAQVFQGATKSMNQQKGMAENDQKARRLTILLRGDLSLESRTFVDVIPFTSGQNTSTNAGSLYSADRRKGYFSISENDPRNNTDDVLQFTVKLPVGQFFSGRATLLKFANDTVNQTPADDPTAVAADPSTWSVNLGPPLDPMNSTNEQIKFPAYVSTYGRNQPEFDDGAYAPNATGRSQMAEVSYFLRNGNLYRRVLLIRDTYDSTGSGTDANPMGMVGEYGTVYVATYGGASVPSNIVTGSGQFWRDFDYSAFNLGYHYVDPMTGLPATTPNMNVQSRGFRFHTTSSLDNVSDGSLGPLDGLPYSLGIPALRFGSTYYRNDGGLIDSMGNQPPKNVPGWPREFDSNGRFFGRPVLQETAHSNFGYPGRIHNLIASPPNGLNPFDSNTTLNLDTNTGLIQQYSSEISRRGEDVVMTNVHEFDVQVYDDGLASPGFVQLGNTDAALSAGHYHSSQRVGSVNNYDTWHPSMPGPPPYRPITTGLDGVNGAPGDDNANGLADALDPAEAGWLGTDDEVPLKAILITVRYLDVASNQMRQLSLVHTLKQ